MRLVLRIVIGIVAIGFFIWLITPSKKSSGSENRNDKGARARRIGFAIGYLRNRNHGHHK